MKFSTKLGCIAFTAWLSLILAAFHIHDGHECPIIGPWVGISAAILVLSVVFYLMVAAEDR